MPHTGAETRLGPREIAGLFIGLGALLTVVYRPALEGSFASDDVWYYRNPFTSQLSLENVLAILDPLGLPRLYQYNYAPLHLLLVAVENQLFGPHMLGYHLVNLALHTLASVLLVQLLLSSGVPRTAALLAGSCFALHPAHVEAVAWLSQLKSVSALSLGLAAVLALWRRPAASTALFALSLLAKFSAAAFLPMAAALAWSRGCGRRTGAWLGAWLAVLAAVSAAQLASFAGGGGYELEAYASPFEQLRSIAAIGARYLWMAATGLGLSAYHEPSPASPWDPWWLAGLAIGGLLTWRTVTTLRRRREEAAWWLAAAAGFLPISQLVPFRFPMADRYLYFILPGLLGGVLLAGCQAWRQIAQRPDPRLPTRALEGALLALGFALALLFAYQSSERAPIWREGRLLLLDAARHYPAGSHAHYLRAVEAAQRGDSAGAVAELRAAEEKKRFSLVREYGNDAQLTPIRDAPVFQEFLRETARFRIELVARRGLRPGEEALVALKHASLGQYDEAIGLLEEALRLDDSRRQELLALLDDLRERRRQRDAGDLPR